MSTYEDMPYNRRGSDPVEEKLNEMSESLAGLHTDVALINNTLKHIKWLFILILPMLLSWNIYLGKNVADTRAMMQTQQYILDQHREMLRDQGKAIAELKYDARDVRSPAKF